MISPDRQLLQQQIYNFLRSATIKYEPMVQYVNESVQKKGYLVDYQNPGSWKYYLNMQGKYHESDTLMYVTSLDNRQVILFSPENLANNLRTKAVYVPGGPYYNKLCDLYPEQVDLIKSILFPVTDVNKAIMADDLTLLGYGSGYLEDYEESVLVMEIERFLSIYKERWYFSFLGSEPYFYLTAWASLWVQLAMLLMSSRVAHIKTAFVHNWDLWNELEANGLSNYSDILNREQAMMLYQNIDYLKVNAGKQSNLTILSDRLLAPFGIGLYGRTVVQESETGAANYQLTPQLVPVRVTKGPDRSAVGVQIKTVQEIQDEIYAKGLTSSDSAEAAETVERKLGDTTLNDFATKFMELRPSAQIKPYASLLNTFLLETLIVSIKQGYYTKPVEVRDPLTNDPIYLPPAELLALYNYASLQAIGIDSQPFPTKVKLYTSFLPTLGTPSLTIPYFDTTLYLSQVVDVNDYLSGLDYAQNIQSPDEFSTNATNLWLRFMAHRLLDESTCLDKAHAAYSYVSSMCHTRREESISLVTGYDTYDDWLGDGGIDLTSTILSQYSIQADPKEQWGNLADAIMTALIPINSTLTFFGNFTLSNSGYDRLRQLFVQMTSYHLVFIESDRDIAEFDINVKWSTNYGPVDMHSYSESLGGFDVHLTNHTVKTSDLHLHDGVIVHRQSSAHHPVNYTVTSIDVITKGQFTQRGNNTKAQSFNQVKSSRTSRMNLGYNPPVPVEVNP